MAKMKIAGRCWSTGKIIGSHFVPSKETEITIALPFKIKIAGMTTKIFLSIAV